MKKKIEGKEDLARKEEEGKPPTAATVATTKEETGKAEEYKIAVEVAGEHLRSVVDAILQPVPPPERGRIASWLQLLSEGSHWLEATAACGLDGHKINALKRVHKGFISLIMAARETGELIRRERREQVAHDRAVNGTERPVFQAGALVGHVREFDNRLLEFLLKADNPGKYRDRAAETHISVHTQALMQQLQGSDVSSLIKRPAAVVDRVDAPPDPIPPKNIGVFEGRA
jgi:hypothetical protein